MRRFLAVSLATSACLGILAHSIKVFNTDFDKQPVNTHSSPFLVVVSGYLTQSVYGYLAQTIYGIAWASWTSFFIFTHGLAFSCYAEHIQAISSISYGRVSLAALVLSAVQTQLCGLGVALYVGVYIWPISGTPTLKKVISLLGCITRVEQVTHSVATARDAINNANSIADALHQDIAAGQALLHEQGKLLSTLRRKLKRNQSTEKRQLMSSLNKRVIVQRVQHQKLQKQKCQHFKLLKELQALTYKAYLHDRKISVQTQQLSRLDSQTSEHLMQQTDNTNDLQRQVDILTAQLALQHQQHQQQTAAQAGRIDRLEQQVSASNVAQTQLQSLQSLQELHEQQLQSLRNELDATAEQHSELARRQDVEGAGLKSQFQLANRVTEDLAGQVKVLVDSVSTPAINLEANSTTVEPATSATPEPASLSTAAGDASPLKVRRGSVYNIAARFGATVAPAKMAASLRKSYSAGRASRRSEMQERAPLLVRANQSDFSGRFSVIERSVETAPGRGGPSPVAGPPLRVPWTSSQDEVIPALASMSPLLSAEGHSSFDLSTDAFGAEGDVMKTKGRGLLRKLSSSNKGQRVADLIKSFRQRS